MYFSGIRAGQLSQKELFMHQCIRLLSLPLIISVLLSFVACGPKYKPIDTSTLPAPLSACGREHLPFHSNLLNKEMFLYVHLPFAYDSSKEYPVVYLLHGFANNEIEWFEYYGMDKIADTLTEEGKIAPMILVSVRMDNSWGIDSGEVKQLSTNPRNSLYQGPYESYLLKEVIPLVESRYPAKKEAAARCIAGISMGGYSALHIGLRNQKIFGAIAGHSPALRGNIVPDWFLYTKKRPAAKNDPILLAAKQKQGTTRLWIDCGESDSLLEGAKEMKQVLEANGWKISFSTAPGAHNSDYWIPRLGEYLAFYTAKSE